MTRKVAAQKIKDLDAEKIVYKIIEILSTENYNDAKTILEIVGVYISASSLVDLDVVKQNLKFDVAESDGDDFD